MELFKFSIFLFFYFCSYSEKFGSIFILVDTFATHLNVKLPTYFRGFHTKISSFRFTENLHKKKEEKNKRNLLMQKTNFNLKEGKDDFQKFDEKNCEDFPNINNEECVGIIGCGYVGSSVADCLLKKGNFVKVTTTTSSKLTQMQEKYGKENVFFLPSKDDEIKLVLFDFFDNISDLLISVAPRGPKDTYDEVYFKTVRNLIDVLIERKKQEKSIPKRIVYLSSAGVYGDISDGRWLNEDDTPGNLSSNQKVLLSTEDLFTEISPPPKSPYLSLIEEEEENDEENKSKENVQEEVSDLTSSNTKSKKEKEKNNAVVTILRLGGVVGPGRYFESVARNLAGKEAFGGKTFINLIHLNDIIKVILWAFLGKTDGVYNLNANPVTRDRFFNKVTDHFGVQKIEWKDNPVPVENQPATHLSGHMTGRNSKRLDTQKLTATGYSFVYPNIMELFEKLDS